MTEKEKKERHEFITKLSRKVKQIPILLVIGSTEQIYSSYGEPVDPENEDLTTGNNRVYKALCPFHNDDHLGSFIITPSKNMWWCFVEGIGSSTIDFEMKKYDLSYSNAVLHLAKRFSLLSKEEEKKYAGSVKVRDVHVHDSVKLIKKSKVEQKKADPVFIDMVYKMFPLTFPLSEKHRAHLLNERCVPEYSLSDYFSYPSASTDAAKELYMKAAEIASEKMFGKKVENLSEAEKTKVEELKLLKAMRTELIYVPGFYKEHGKIRLMRCNGIGFLVKGERKNVGDALKQQAKGINVRRDTVEKGGKRYVWMSSSYAAGRPGNEGGSSPGAPGGIIYPPGKIRKKNLIITEGRFKAEAAARRGNIVIYVSGVSNWKSVMDMVIKTKEMYGITAIFAMFDSDLMGNTAVHGQLISMCDEIKQKTGLSPRLLLWKIRYGKGFDDLIVKTGNAYTSYMYSIEYTKFEGLYQKALRETLAALKAADVRSIPRNKSARFRQLLQSNVESAVEKENRRKQDS